MQHVPFAGAERAKRVRLQPQPILEDPAALAAMALAAARAGAAVLVVRNTVGGAIAAQEALEALHRRRRRSGRRIGRCCSAATGVPTLHHGRFAREDRRLLDRRSEARLGRDRPPAAPSSSAPRPWSRASTSTPTC